MTSSNSLTSTAQSKESFSCRDGYVTMVTTVAHYQCSTAVCYVRSSASCFAWSQKLVHFLMHGADCLTRRHLP